MNENKPWYLSLGVWAGLITVVASIAGLAGYTLGDEDQQAIAGSAVGIATTITGLLAIYARVRASKKIGKE